MDADANSDWAREQSVLCFTRRVDCASLGGEGDEERVPLRVNLDAAMAGERVAQDAAMLEQGRAIGIRAQFVQQLRRALHVGEEKRDGS